VKISPEVSPYLSGEKFSNGLDVRYECNDQDYVYRSRIDVLRELCQSKNVVHLGCVDHNEDMIARKLEKNKWLHKHLCDVSERCFGIDLSENGIQYLKGELGYQDSAVLDITAGSCESLEQLQWDYLLIPEVLEHIGNPVQFLADIKKQHSGRFKQVVITVPNAFSLDIMKQAVKGIETINTDHRFWFTPYTLSKVVHSAGLKPQKIIMCKGGIVKKRSVFRNYKFSRNPLLRGNIVMLCSMD